jgi:hypothetical protein
MSTLDAINHTEQGSSADSESISLTRSQAIAGLDPKVREIEATRATRLSARRYAKIVRAATRVDRLRTRAIRSMHREMAACQQLRDTTEVLRPMGALSAALLTALLMFAGYFSIRAVLAAADMSPLETSVLPLAFGPVFVLATKLITSSCLNAAIDSRAARQLLTSWIIVPIFLLAGVGLISGVGLKSMAVGSLEPLSDGYAHVSSTLMFAALMLGELAGAAALSVRQHAPGAMTYEHARANERRTRRAASTAIDRAFRAAARHEALIAKQLGLFERQLGRGVLARAYGWLKMAKASTTGDAFLNIVKVAPYRLDAPAETQLSVVSQAPGIAPYQPTLITGRPSQSIDLEFRRLLNRPYSDGRRATQSESLS